MIFKETFFENRQRYNDYMHIRQIGRVNADKSYIITRSNSETYVYGFVKSGILHIEVLNMLCQINPGESFALPTGIDYKMYSNEENPPILYWMNIRGKLIDCLHMALFNGKFMICQYNSESDFHRFIKLAKKDNVYLEIVKELTDMLVSSKQNEIEIRFEQTDEKNSLAKEFEAYISNCVQFGLSVKKMAKEFNMSVDKLNRVFKKEFNSTPYQYYQSIRIDIAKSMLKCTDSSIDDISEKLIFTDRNYFSLCFKQKTGCSPASYRKSFLK